MMSKHNDIKNSSLSFLKRSSKSKNKEISYLDFVIPLENDAHKNVVYPELNKIKKYGYTGYHTMFKNNTKYLYNAEDLFCLLKNDHKYYNQYFKLEDLKGLKVMTWNIHNWVQICSNDELSKKRKVKEFIEYMDKYKPDIICIQEIVPNNGIEINKNIFNENNLKKLNFEYIIKLFESYGYKYNVIANANIDATHKKDDSTNYFYLGNAIFSKIVIEKYYIFGIPYNRNIIIIKILYKSKPVYIVNVHMEYIRAELKETYSKYELYLKLLKEEKENAFQLNMNILLKLLSKIKTNNIIVCGDFNHSYFGKYKLLRLNLAKKVFIPFMGLYKDTTMYPKIFNRVTNLKSRQNLTTDFIFLNKKSNLYIEKSYVLYSDLSDHYPVYTSFNWK